MTNKACGGPAMTPHQAQRWCCAYLSSGSLSWSELSLKPQQLESVPRGSGSPFSTASWVPWGWPPLACPFSGKNQET